MNYWLLPATKAYCAVHSSLSWSSVEISGDSAIKMYKLASSNESQDELTSGKNIVKLVYMFFTLIIFFDKCFILSVTLFILFVWTNIKGEDHVNVPHWNRQLSEDFCACQAKRFCMISVFFFHIWSWQHII